MMRRVILLVLDSAGVGALPDAGIYGDSAANTLGHVFDAMGPSYALPNLAALGLYNLLAGRRPTPDIVNGAYGKMMCASPAKDTTAGHWELAGLVLDKAFPVYPNGFPADLIAAFERRIGTRVLGNKTASGTAIIAELGAEHCRTGYPIVYTSADSVFQVAAHETAFGLERLYDICRTARALLSGEHAVGRVIARPFTGGPGSFTRTENRRDFSLEPPRTTLLDRIKNTGGSVVAIGKIEDIFNGRGITRAYHTTDNLAGMRRTREALADTAHDGPALIFTNLVDFDMRWGHRRDTAGYAQGLRAFDDFLPEIMAALSDDDLLMLTADHGCDPTVKTHTDHTREYAPLLVYGKQVRRGAELGVRRSFADVAQTVCDLFSLERMAQGESFKRGLGL